MLAKDGILAALAARAGAGRQDPLPQSGAIDGVTIRDGKVFLAIKVDPAPRQGDGGHARGGRSEDQGAARRRLGAGDADRRERRARRAPPRPARARPRARPPRATSRSRASTRSSRSPRAKAASASRPPPAISRSASPQLGLKVGVLDADLFGPSMPRLFGITHSPTLAPDGQKLRPIEKFGVKVMSIGFLVGEGAAIVGAARW